MTTTKSITATAAMFGAAMTSIYAAPDLQAEVVDLTFTPSTIETSAPANITLNTNSAFIGSVNINNGASTRSIGIVGSDIAAIGIFNSGDDIVGGAATSSGFSFGAGLSTGSVSFSSGQEQAIIGFQNSEGNVGFFTVEFGDPAQITGGVFGSGGESLVAGVSEPTGVPEPASGLTLAALALGAVGVRRRRQVA